MAPAAQAKKLSASEAAFAKSLPTGLELVNMLGSGSHGSVAAVRWSKSLTTKRTLFALKKVSGVFEDPVMALRTIREIRLLSHFQHPNVISIQAATLHGPDAFIRLPLLEADLGACLRHEMLEETMIKKIFYQVMCGLLCLHNAHVTHRDLKPHNVLVSSDGSVKIADLGMARSMDVPKDAEDAPELTEYVVTRWYRAPEVVLTATRYSYAMDIWAAGCILGEMIVGYPLFKGNDPLNQLQCIISTIEELCDEDLEWIDRPSASWTFVERSCKGRIKDAEDVQPLRKLRRDLASGATGSGGGQFRSKATRDDALDLLVELIRFNPGDRPTAQAVLNQGYLQEAASEDERAAIKAALAAEPLDWSFDHELCFDSEGNARPFSVKSFKSALLAACEKVNEGKSSSRNSKSQRPSKVDEEEFEPSARKPLRSKTPPPSDSGAVFVSVTNAETGAPVPAEKMPAKTSSQGFTASIRKSTSAVRRIVGMR